MAVEYTNRKGQLYYLHQGTTKTGKPKYFFSMKSDGSLVKTVPDGFEIYENPNAQVFLQKKQPKIITDEEIAIVERGMNKLSCFQYYQIDVKKDIIYIYTPNENTSNLSELFSESSLRNGIDIKTGMSRVLTYSSMLRFILDDEHKRTFTTERFCFLGSIDDWIEIGYPDTLQKLIEQYVKHLGKDSFYELH